MNTYRRGLLLCALALVIVPLTSRAITPVSPPTAIQEKIEAYFSDIVVNTDSSIDVVETIVYNTGPEEHHGIYRDLRTVSSQGRKMEVWVSSVTDEEGNDHPYTTSDSRDSLRIKIGDPDVTFSGQRTYVISYHATRALGQLNDFDELYWNVTGNEWEMPIDYAEATVALPEGVAATQSACYYGFAGAKDRCDEPTVEEGVYTFSLENLYATEGLTIAVGFPKGFVTPYTESEGMPTFLERYGVFIFALLLPLVTLLLSLWRWYAKGRDPRGKGVIIPQYDVLDALTPMEVAGIVKERVSTNQIPAEIIHLAVQGYLKINQLEERYVGLTKKADYELIRLRGVEVPDNEADRKLLLGLFADGADKVTLADLEDEFYRRADAIETSVLDALLNKGYYKNLGRMQSKGFFIVPLVLSVWLAAMVGSFVSDVFGVSGGVLLVASVLASGLMWGLVWYFSPAKTEKGIATMEHLLGLKMYLQIAEKNRLEFHNAPEKKPEVFEKLLPYAMVLGVADIWAKEFEGICTASPAWYTSSSTSAFNTVVFAHALGDFSSHAASSIASSPSSSSSGSGGGGSSGGGGGGGGGGSW